MRLVYGVLMVCVLAVPVSAQIARTVTVTGMVQDQTGAVLPAATVELLNGSGGLVQTGITDAGGSFRFERVPSGPYELRAGYVGFRPTVIKLRVGTQAPALQRLVLDLAALTQEITVSSAPISVGTAAGNNVDAITIDQDMLPACRSSTTTLSPRCRSFSMPARSAMAA
jgi:carboxypeptidase family protein